ncbi:hypothetical protein C0585_05120 [Candidatus Woesearchaeota archaeon]|nr:MAG: hypothetical protein C0585_05120 [Candidatus Woesearchaeota archaeon]
MNDRYKKFLETFDQIDKKNFSEIEIGDFIRKNYSKEEINNDQKIYSENIAFEFSENNESTSRFYYGEKIIFKDTDGNLIHYPTIKNLNKNIIEYWEKRTNEAENPILMWKYTGLILEFKKPLTKEKPVFDIFVKHINSAIEIANGNYDKYKLHTFEKLKRALSLSISYKNDELINRIVNTIIEFEENNAIDDKAGLWGYAFEFLLNNDKVELDSEKKNKIIQDMEERFTRLTNKESFNAWTAEKAGIILAEYYKKNNDKINLSRIIECLCEAMESFSSKNNSTLFFEKTYSIYKNYGFNEKAEKSLIKLKELSKEVPDTLQTFSANFEISNEKIESLLKKLSEGSFGDVIKNNIIYFLPNKENTIKQLEDLAKTAPLNYVMPMKLINENGVTIAKIGSLMEDQKGHIIYQIYQNLLMISPLLTMSFENLIKNRIFTKEKVSNFLFLSPVFTKEQETFIKLSLENYFNENYIVFVSLIIPQIEKALRNLVEKSGGNILKPNKSEGFDVRLFHDVINDEIVKKTFGENAILYFKVFYLDKRGLNLRNNVCHGLFTEYSLNKDIANRVLHTLLILGSVRENK